MLMIMLHKNPFKNISIIKGINSDEDENSWNIIGKKGKVTIEISVEVLILLFGRRLLFNLKDI